MNYLLTSFKENVCEKIHINYKSVSDYLNKNPLLLKNTNSNITDLNAEEKRTDLRILKDLATDAYVHALFYNSTVTIYFLDYIYHKMNYKILSNINEYLINNNHNPLSRNERLYFVLKGGTNIFFLFKKFIENSNLNIDNEYILSKFKISDSDFSLYILCDTTERYNELYKYSTFLLTKSLEEISEDFDNIIDEEYNFPPKCDSIQIKLNKTIKYW